MMYNQRGGIISKIIIIPAGVALMVGFFFLGYYVGKYQNKSDTQGENALPLPEMTSKNNPGQEEFTFYKTLTDKSDKTVSIDLKPRPAQEEKKSEKESPGTGSPKAIVGQPLPMEKRIELKTDKEVAAPTKPKQTASLRPQAQARKETAPASSSTKLRYTLQIASCQERGMAEDEVKKMKQRGYAAFIASSELPGKGMWHRVRIGSFSNRAAAEKLQKEIRAKAGVSPIITIE